MSSKSASLPENRDENEPSMEEILASIRKIIADDSLGMKKDEPAPKKVPPKKEPEPPAPEPVVEEEPEVLDLAKVGTVASSPQIVMVEPEPEPVLETMSEVRMEAATQMNAASNASIQSVSALEERILSDNTGVLVGQAFQTLARHTAMPAIGRSIEDVVAEILRPMLRDWMDHHLHGIVEKLVRAEIERVARG
jgi:cell pole-organizing protein PopZ